MIKGTFRFLGCFEIIPRNAGSRPIVIDKDQPNRSLGSMSRDEIFKAFNSYMFS